MTVFVNAIMYYRVEDAIKVESFISLLVISFSSQAVTNVDDYAGSAQALAATTLRKVLLIIIIIITIIIIIIIITSGMFSAPGPWGTSSQTGSR